MRTDTTQNESYDLAEAWVLDQIDAGPYPVMEGSMIEAADMHQCDCVPVDFRDDCGRRWRLKAVEWSGSLTRLAGTLTATYACVETGD